MFSHGTCLPLPPSFTSSVGLAVSRRAKLQPAQGSSNSVSFSFWDQWLVKVYPVASQGTLLSWCRKHKRVRPITQARFKPPLKSHLQTSHWWSMSHGRVQSHSVKKYTLWGEPQSHTAKVVVTGRGDESGPIIRKHSLMMPQDIKSHPHQHSTIPASRYQRPGLPTGLGVFQREKWCFIPFSSLSTKHNAWHIVGIWRMRVGFHQWGRVFVLVSGWMFIAFVSLFFISLWASTV